MYYVIVIIDKYAFNSQHNYIDKPSTDLSACRRAGLKILICVRDFVQICANEQNHNTNG